MIRTTLPEEAMRALKTLVEQGHLCEYALWEAQFLPRNAKSMNRWLEKATNADGEFDITLFRDCAVPALGAVEEYANEYCTVILDFLFNSPQTAKAIVRHLEPIARKAAAKSNTSFDKEYKSCFVDNVKYALGYLVRHRQIRLTKGRYESFVVDHQIGSVIDRIQIHLPSGSGAKLYLEKKIVAYLEQLKTSLHPFTEMKEILWHVLVRGLPQMVDIGWCDLNLRDKKKITDDAIHLIVDDYAGMIAEQVIRVKRLVMQFIEEAKGKVTITELQYGAVIISSDILRVALTELRDEEKLIITTTGRKFVREGEIHDEMQLELNQTTVAEPDTKEDEKPMKANDADQTAMIPEVEEGDDSCDGTELIREIMAYFEYCPVETTINVIADNLQVKPTMIYHRVRKLMKYELLEEIKGTGKKAMAYAPRKKDPTTPVGMVLHYAMMAGDEGISVSEVLKLTKQDHHSLMTQIAEMQRELRKFIRLDIRAKKFYWCQ